MKIRLFKEELIRTGFIVFLSTLGLSIVAFFANIIVANILGAEYFGTYKTIIYLFSFLPLIADIGINSSLIKYIAEFGKESEKTKHLINWFLKIKFLSYVVLIVVIFLLKDSIALYFLKDVSLNYLILASIFLMAFNFFSTFSSITLGFQNFKLYSLSQFLNSTISFLLSILLSPLGLFYMILGYSLGPLIGNLPNMLFFLKKRTFHVHEKIDMKKIFFKFTLPIYPIELCASLFNVIVPLLSLFFSQKLIGYYSFAFMFYYITTIIPSSLSTVLFPKVSELSGLNRHGDAKIVLRKAVLYYSLIAISGLVFVLLFSEWFIILIAKDFLPSLLMFKIIVSLGFIFGYVVIYSNYLKGLGKVRKFALFTLIQNIVLIIASFLLLTNF